MRSVETAVRASFVRYRATGHPGALDAVLGTLLCYARRTVAARAQEPQAIDDVVQDAFLRVIQHASSYDPSCDFRSWFRAVLLNCCRASHRAVQRRERTVPLEWDPIDAKLHDADRHEKQQHVRDAIARLPQPYREVVELHVTRELPPLQIAALLERRPSTVRTQLARGLDHMRPILRQLSCGG
ncbi:MAG: sigma-70 family RNA polymerase sigma factor [Planctomycetes bacterium]|nr:sigma-70 family RNA polymerase sigma factor [Planctomycetota bacterium]